jgi:hypothetical protein
MPKRRVGRGKVRDGEGEGEKQREREREGGAYSCVKSLKFIIAVM